MIRCIDIGTTILDQWTKIIDYYIKKATNSKQLILCLI